MSLICKFCNYELKTKSSLNYYQKNAKFCLKIQEKEQEQDKYKCNLCYKILSSKQRMESHKKICNVKRDRDPEQLIRKNKGLDIDRKEYNTMNTLKEKAFEVGCEILNIEDTNKFSTELASLSSI